MQRSANILCYKLNVLKQANKKLMLSSMLVSAALRSLAFRPSLQIRILGEAIVLMGGRGSWSSRVRAFMSSPNYFFPFPAMTITYPPWPIKPPRPSLFNVHGATVILYSIHVHISDLFTCPPMSQYPGSCISDVVLCWRVLSPCELGGQERSSLFYIYGFYNKCIASLFTNTEQSGALGLAKSPVRH